MTGLALFIHNLSNWHLQNRITYPWRSENRVFIRCVVELLLRRTTAEAILHRWNVVLGLTNPRIVFSMSDAKLESIIKPFGLISSRKVEIKALAKAHMRKSLAKREELELLDLKGIGKYTSAAIRCFVSGKRAILCDSNIARVINRLTFNNFKPDDQLLLKQLDKAIPKEPIKCKSVNEAFLDFAKLICRPSYPKCSECFASNYCIYNTSRM